MNKVLIFLLFVWLLLAHYQLQSAYTSPVNLGFSDKNQVLEDPESELKKAAFSILDSKCNVCHRKKNPFKIFSLKNMDKNAKKIYKQVFVTRRMPKGNEIKLTEEEYQTIKNWLKSKNIY